MNWLTHVHFASLSKFHPMTLFLAKEDLIGEIVYH